MLVVFSYSKLAQGAIAAVSYLSAKAGESRLIGSAEISKERDLSRPLVAKILTILSTAGLVKGTPGPMGGYTLTRPPSEISLLDVVKIFDDTDTRVMCPFGPIWCGVGPLCPLHDKFAELHDKLLERMDEETFAQFIGHPL